MNPRMQDMKALLFMLPRIWKMEDRVAGADLGMGRFQFDFDQEEDITEVLQMEPFHFDYWMLSLERWAPGMDRNQPSKIMFWVRVIGLQLEWWAEPTFRSIGQGLGLVPDNGVDLDNGRVRVLIDGLKPLVFETDVNFHTGDQVVISLRYEKLYGYCRRCHSLCHDVDWCPLYKGNQDQVSAKREEPQGRTGLEPRSYKGAAHSGIKDGTLGRNKEETVQKPMWTKGFGRGGTNKVYYRAKTTQRGERSEGRSENAGESLTQKSEEVFAAIPAGENQLKRSLTETSLPDPTRIMLEAFQGKELEGNQKFQEVTDRSTTKEGEVCEQLQVTAEEVSPDIQNEIHGEEGSKEDLGMQNESMVDSDLIGDEEEEWFDNAMDVEEVFNEKEMMAWENAEDNSVVGMDRGVRKHSAKKKLFQKAALGVGGTTKRRLVHAMVSPRKGTLGRGKGKDDKGMVGARGATSSRRLAVGDAKATQDHDFN